MVTFHIFLHGVVSNSKQALRRTDEAFKETSYIAHVNCVLKVNANEVFPDQGDIVMCAR